MHLPIFLFCFVFCVLFLFLYLVLWFTYYSTIGTYFTSITNFMQGYLDNEINLNGERKCDGTCSDYKSAQNHECQNDTICAHSNFARTRCTGNIFDCNPIDTDGTACLVVCFLSYKLNSKCHHHHQRISRVISLVDAHVSFSTQVIFVYFQHYHREMNWKIDAIIL